MWASAKAVCSANMRRCATSIYAQEFQHSSATTSAYASSSVLVNSKTSNTRLQVTSVRGYARKSFFENLMDSVKQEYGKDKELQKNIESFRQESQKLGETVKTESLKFSREKFKKIEKETNQSEVTEAFKDSLKSIKENISKTAESVGQSEIGKAAGKISEGVSGAAKSAAESETVKKVASSFENIAKGSGVAPSSLYRPPPVLRMRKIEYEGVQEREIVADETTTNMVMHKDSVWNQQWESFKNSKVGEKISNMRMAYDESDNLFVRGSRFIIDRVTSAAGSLAGGTEISKIMTEVAKIEPNFSAVDFIKFCQYDVIPNVLEGIAQGKYEIVKDWCSEAPYTQMMFPVEQAEKLQCSYDLKIVDVDHVDIAGATKVDQGPVLVISFQTQQMMAVKNKRGEVVDGSDDKIMKVYYVWALCRDVEEMDPLAGWKIIDQSMSATPMLL